MRVFLTLTVLLALGGTVLAQDMPLQQSGATLTLKVTSFAAAQDALAKVARESGGRLSDGETFVTEKGRRHGWVRLRLPQKELPAVLERIRATGTLSSEGTSTDSYQAAHAELLIRADALHAHASRLGGLLDSERRMRAGDILYLQERLFRASVDEELLRQRRENLEATTKQSSVIVTLFEPYPVRLRDRLAGDLASRFHGGMGAARDRAFATLARGATGVGYALTLAPLWAPILLLLIGGLRLFWKRIGKTLLGRALSDGPGFLRTSGARLWELFQRIEQKRAALSVKYALADELPTRVDGADDLQVPAGAGGERGIEIANAAPLPDDGAARA
jgi:hypothetical protein